MTFPGFTLAPSGGAGNYVIFRNVTGAAFTLTAAGGRVPWGQLMDPSGAVRTWPQRDDADAFYAVRLRAAPGPE